MPRFEDGADKGELQGDQGTALDRANLLKDLLEESVVEGDPEIIVRNVLFVVVGVVIGVSILAWQIPSLVWPFVFLVILALGGGAIWVTAWVKLALLKVAKKPGDDAHGLGSGVVGLALVMTGCVGGMVSLFWWILGGVDSLVCFVQPIAECRLEESPHLLIGTVPLYRPEGLWASVTVITAGLIVGGGRIKAVVASERWIQDRMASIRSWPRTMKIAVWLLLLSFVLQFPVDEEVVGFGAKKVVLVALPTIVFLIVVIELLTQRRNWVRLGIAGLGLLGVWWIIQALLAFQRSPVIAICSIVANGVLVLSASHFLRHETAIWFRQKPDVVDKAE